MTNRELSFNDSLISLQEEIAALEAELASVKKSVGIFETEIHSSLDKEIMRVKELSMLYKRQKAQKKAKRLEQKKRGKNYKEPKQIKTSKQGQDEEKTTGLSIEDQKEFKRLYKEVVVQVHPDKISHGGEESKIQRATAITAQLNAIYKSGDLEELINFYQDVISGNAMPEIVYSMEHVADPKARLASLIRKKEAIVKHLEQVKNSYIYGVLTRYENPLTFISELYIQFHERIIQLEKRTRKG